MAIFFFPRRLDIALNIISKREQKPSDTTNRFYLSTILYLSAPYLLHLIPRANSLIHMRDPDLVNSPFNLMANKNVMSKKIILMRRLQTECSTNITISKCHDLPRMSRDINAGFLYFLLMHADTTCYSLSKRYNKTSVKAREVFLACVLNETNSKAYSTFFLIGFYRGLPRKG